MVAHILCLLATLTLAATLRLWALGVQSLELDEARDVIIARLPWRDVLVFFNPLDPNPPGYHVALHGWMLLAGQSELSVRALSACCGVATVMVLYLIVSRIVNRQSGLVAALLLAVAPMHIYWSRQVSPWALVCLLMSVQVLLLITALKHRSELWRWELLALGNGALLYTHYTAAALIATLTLIGALTLRNDRRSQVWLWISALLPVAALAPLAVVRSRDITMLIPGVQSAPTLTALPRAFAYLIAWNAPLPLAYLLVLPSVGIAGLGLLTLFRLGRTRTAGLLMIWLIGAPCFLFLASYVTGVYVARYALPSLPAFATLLAVGAGAIGHRARQDARRLTRGWSERLPRRRAVQAGFTVAFGLTMLSLTVFSGVLDAAYYTSYQTEPWRALVAQVQAQEQPGDMILLANPSGYTEPAFDYYFAQGAHPLSSQIARHAIPEDWSLTSTGQTTLDTQSAVTRLTALLQGHQRVWIVVREDDNAAWAASLIALMPPWYTEVSITTFTSDGAPLTLSLWERSTQTAP